VRKNHLFIFLTAVAAIAASGNATASGLFDCKVSGTVSWICCCAPSAANECASVDRECDCCDISVVQQEANPATAAIHIEQMQIPTAHCALILMLGKSANDEHLKLRIPSLTCPTALYILNHSFLR
jgi:hypothetical protein